MPQSLFLPHQQLQDLIDNLIAAGYACIGPQVRNEMITYDVLTNSDQLPWGIRDKQSAGHYQLTKIKEKRAFAFSNSAQAIKPLLFQPEETVWQVERDSKGQLVFQPKKVQSKPIAIIGAKACDLSAMAIQDQVFLSGQYKNPHYLARRESLFVVAANCGYSSDNCFCVSAGPGPRVTQNFDIGLTEIKDGFVVEIASDRGEAVIAKLNLKKANKTQITAAEKEVELAAKMQKKSIPFDNQAHLKDALFDNLEHPQWEKVAKKCLSCGNCTQVCPTCFCSTTVDKTEIDNSISERTVKWDSCFTQGHSYLNGKIIRDDTKKRYRQWLTHKFGSWFDQFGQSGCVGCGRCIAWCPVGIDVTEELTEIAHADTKD